MAGRTDRAKSLSARRLGVELKIVYESILELMREAARNNAVYLTLHANKELKNDRLDYDDVINCLLTGVIVEQQLDETEEKYLIYGDAESGDEMACVAKLGYNNATLIITVFRLRTTDYEF